MSDPSYALQIAIRKRLVSTPALVALVPAENILDTHSLPVVDPCIIFGEDQEIDPDEQTITRRMVRVYSTLHVWKREESLRGVKLIAGAIRRAIETTYRLNLDDPDFHCADCHVSEVRFMRDPDGVTSHGIVTLDSLVAKMWVPA